MKNEIIIFEEEDVRLEVNLQDETVWLTQTQMVELFKSIKANISEHIKKILLDGELEIDSVVRNFRTAASDGKKYMQKFYNLDMIISVGYRVNSREGSFLEDGQVKL